MATTEGIKRRIGTVEDLRAIVRTMKALAAANIRQYEDAVLSVEDYARAVELGLQILLKIRPDVLERPAPKPGASRTGAIVFGSDHGLCGSFNEQIATYYMAERDTDGADRGEHLMAVGGRVVSRLEELGVRPARALTLPASVVGVAALVRELLEHVASWRTGAGVDSVRLYFNAPRSHSGYAPRTELLLPLDNARLKALAAAPWRPRATPVIAGDWNAHLSGVVQQHLFVTLHRAIAQSLASENASRLAAMYAAERNIDERLHTLRARFNQERQESITTELLDIVSGYEVLVDRSRLPAPHTPAQGAGRLPGDGRRTG